jgi:hypothetical protein
MPLTPDAKAAWESVVRPLSTVAEGFNVAPLR